MLCGSLFLRDSLARRPGLLDASPKVQAAAVTVLSQALSVTGLGAETRAALLVSCHTSSTWVAGVVG